MDLKFYNLARSQNMNKLEQFLIALLKRILSLPPNAPNPALYVISSLLLHFILQCEKLQSERVALLSEINAIWQNEFQNNENFTDLSEDDQLQLLMDNTINVESTKKNSASVARLEGLSRRLMFKLHIKRTKLLESDRDKIQTTMKKRN
jgi:hypothetical protein